MGVGFCIRSSDFHSRRGILELKPRPIITESTFEAEILVQSSTEYSIRPLGLLLQLNENCTLLNRQLPRCQLLPHDRPRVLLPVH